LAVAGIIAFLVRVLVVHAGDEAAQIGDKSGEGQAQRLPPRQKHIVMSGLKVTRTGCRSRPKTSFYTISFGGIADFLGDGETDTRISLAGGDCLQPKRRAPGAIAPGSSQKLRAPLETAQCRFRLRIVGRHPASNPLGRELLAAKRAATIENRAAILGCHASTETMTTGTNELGGLVCTLHNIRPRFSTVPLLLYCSSQKLVMAATKWRCLGLGRL